MPLTTPVEALDQYAANCLYDLHRSASECLLFIEACRVLLAMMPKQSKSGRMGGEQTTSPEEVSKALDKAEAWYSIYGASSAAGAGGGRERVQDFSDFRC